MNHTSVRVKAPTEVWFMSMERSGVRMSAFTSERKVPTGGGDFFMNWRCQI